MKTNLAKIIYLKYRYWLKSFFSAKEKKRYKNIINSKKCIVMLAADYGNLGDVAITYAQEKWLAKHFPTFEIVDVPISRTSEHLKALKRICTPNDIITIVGGGNMSDLYFDIELLRQQIVKTFTQNRIIIFPQTMFWGDTIGAKYLKNRARRIYSKHTNITVAAREIWTNETMKSMSIDCILLPDVVMTLDERKPEEKRNGITMCLRKDKESGLTDSFVRMLIDRLKENYAITDSDTHIGRDRLNYEEREKELKNIWKQFRSSEWIITDRLHGMIFAFITGTPCIVLPNNNFKIEGCYKWIKDCGYVFYMGECNVDDILDRLEKPIINDFDEVSKRIHRKFEKIC